ncbi:hypothetical protein [Paraburkholderia dipogonis]|uniref:hypothetical protein n=1 Tax=Paraburkholderia dipogonis TaxID=1211383 RepID=UPI0038B8048C
MGQKLAAYDASGNIIAYYDDVDSPAPAGANVIEITEDEWRACVSTSGYTVASGALVAPVPLTAAQIAAQQAAADWAARQELAKAELDASDVTLIRCFENGIPLPPAWAEYRKALRAIVGVASGDATQPVPVRPDYPTGT